MSISEIILNTYSFVICVSIVLFILYDTGLLKNIRRSYHQKVLNNLGIEIVEMYRYKKFLWFNELNTYSYKENVWSLILITNKEPRASKRLKLLLIYFIISLLLSVFVVSTELDINKIYRPLSVLITYELASKLYDILRTNYYDMCIIRETDSYKSYKVNTKKGSKIFLYLIQIIFLWVLIMQIRNYFLNSMSTI